MWFMRYVSGQTQTDTLITIFGTNSGRSNTSTIQSARQCHTRCSWHLRVLLNLIEPFNQLYCEVYTLTAEHWIGLVLFSRQLCTPNTQRHMSSTGCVALLQPIAQLTQLTQHASHSHECVLLNAQPYKLPAQQFKTGTITELLIS